MARTKIDYGIDLGTTNSAISRMDSGLPSIKKSDTLKDTTPSCVYINKKRAIQVGDSAYNALKRDKLKSMKNWKLDSNAFIEFKRTMGTDKLYPSSNMDRELNSEELSAEILKTLKSFVKDENPKSIVITVPAAFKINQIDATRKAGILAGFDHIEVMQEPVAASMAYGLDNNNRDGFWLVFDFGGGTFDAALLKVEEGIMTVKDTEGDNYLGGKNLDFAIVDRIILPYLQENFSIDSIIEDDTKKHILRNAMKFYAEDAKIAMSFNDSYNILSDLGDIPGEDDDGEEFELDITLSQSDMEQALAPIFQKAIDLSLNLLKRNNLTGSSLESLILVGGPTFSPVLRKMLTQQICKPDTSVDPMTVVSKGAALYASTIDVSEQVREQTRDRTKIQIEIGHESSTVEKEEFVTLKILEEKTDGIIPNSVFAEVTRGDKAWSSGKIEINTIGEIVEVQLNSGKTNIFNIALYDERGNLLESEPKHFSIIQGSKIGSATLPYNMGIEFKQRNTGKAVFTTFKGLEKNQSLPCVGTRNGLKTQKQIRPGMDMDFIKIPIYQGEHGADGTRAIYNEHVYDVVISGNDLPALLPENSDVDLTISLDKSQKITVQAYFPVLDYTTEIAIPEKRQTVQTEWLDREIKKAKRNLIHLKEDGVGNEEKLRKVEEELQEIEETFNNNKNDVDGKQQTLTNLRKSLKVIDELNTTEEWPRLEEELKDEFYRLETANNELGNEKSKALVSQIRNQLEEVLQAKDIRLGNALLDNIRELFFGLTLIYQMIGLLRSFNENFDSLSWSDRTKARQLLNQGLIKVTENPDVEELKPIIIALYDLLPETEQPDGDILVG